MNLGSFIETATKKDLIFMALLLKIAQSEIQKKLKEKSE